MSQQNSKSATISPDGCGCIVLLMCIIVMGVIALPSYLNLTNRAPQSEPKQYLSSMNKGQQAYYAEKSAFSNSIPALGLRLKTETTNYKYSIRTTKTASFVYAVPKEKNLKSYVGAILLFPTYPNAPQDGMSTSSILCEADDRGTIEPAKPIYQNGKVICGKGTTAVTR